MGKESVPYRAGVHGLRHIGHVVLHGQWAMGKIEAGWTFGERRDDTMGLHPCLTQFQNLPQAEKRYNVQLAVQTLRSV